MITYTYIKLMAQATSSPPAACSLLSTILSKQVLHETVEVVALLSATSLGNTEYQVSV